MGTTISIADADARAAREAGSVTAARAAASLYLGRAGNKGVAERFAALEAQTHVKSKEAELLKVFRARRAVVARIRERRGAHADAGVALTCCFQSSAPVTAPVTAPGSVPVLATAAAPILATQAGSPPSCPKLARITTSDLLTSISRDFICPITLELMVDPCMAADGTTYERAAIEAWCARHSTSPVTRTPLDSNILIENRRLRDLIKTFVAVGKIDEDHAASFAHRKAAADAARAARIAKGPATTTPAALIARNLAADRSAVATKSRIDSFERERTAIHCAWSQWLAQNPARLRLLARTRMSKSGDQRAMLALFSPYIAMGEWGTVGSFGWSATSPLRDAPTLIPPAVEHMPDFAEGVPTFDTLDDGGDMLRVCDCDALPLSKFIDSLVDLHARGAEGAPSLDEIVKLRSQVRSLPYAERCFVCQASGVEKCGDELETFHEAMLLQTPDAETFDALGIGLWYDGPQNEVHRPGGDCVIL